MKKKKTKKQKQKILSFPKQLQLEQYFASPIWFADEPSFVWHRVCPVKSGERNSLVIWNLGYPFK